MRQSEIILSWIYKANCYYFAFRKDFSNGKPECWMSWKFETNLRTNTEIEKKNLFILSFNMFLYPSFLSLFSPLSLSFFLFLSFSLSLCFPSSPSPLIIFYLVPKRIKSDGGNIFHRIKKLTYSLQAQRKTTGSSVRHRPLWTLGI